MTDPPAPVCRLVDALGPLLSEPPGRPAARRTGSGVWELDLAAVERLDLAAVRDRVGPAARAGLLPAGLVVEGRVAGEPVRLRFAAP